MDKLVPRIEEDEEHQAHDSFPPVASIAGKV